MNGSDFRRWRTSYGLSQQELGDRMGVTRTTIQNWEAQVGELSTIAANGVKIWDRRLRQEEPLRGPVTLIYADGPMMLSSQGPQRVAMMQQESHLSNAAVLCRVQLLASHSQPRSAFRAFGSRHAYGARATEARARTDRPGGSTGTNRGRASSRHSR
jgi:hypothetical protein